MTVGPALRVRAKVTVVEDPRASLPYYILYSTVCHVFTKTHWNNPQTLPSFALSVVSFQFNLFYFHHLTVCSSLLYLPIFLSAVWNLWFTSYYRHSTSSHFCLPCFAPRCLVLHRLLRADCSTNQDRSLSWSSVLGFHPSLPGQWPASVALLWELLVAVITSGIQALGLLHRWHGGWGWAHGVERRKGRIFLCSWQDQIGAATAGVKL